MSKRLCEGLLMHGCAKEILLHSKTPIERLKSLNIDSCLLNSELLGVTFTSKKDGLESIVYIQNPVAVWRSQKAIFTRHPMWPSGDWHYKTPLTERTAVWTQEGHQPWGILLRGSKYGPKLQLSQLVAAILVNKECSDIKHFCFSGCFKPFWRFQILGPPPSPSPEITWAKRAHQGEHFWK